MNGKKKRQQWMVKSRWNECDGGGRGRKLKGKSAVIGGERRCITVKTRIQGKRGWNPCFDE